MILDLDKISNSERKKEIADALDFMVKEFPSKRNRKKNPLKKVLSYNI